MRHVRLPRLPLALGASTYATLCDSWFKEKWTSWFRLHFNIYKESSQKRLSEPVTWTWPNSQAVLTLKSIKESSLLLPQLRYVFDSRFWTTGLSIAPQLQKPTPCQSCVFLLCLVLEMRWAYGSHNALQPQHRRKPRAESSQVRTCGFLLSCQALTNCVLLHMLI